MRIAICIIYVHDDVDVSVYEYVNVYVDGYANISIDWYMYVQMSADNLSISYTANKLWAQIAS